MSNLDLTERQKAKNNTKKYHDLALKYRDLWVDTFHAIATILARCELDNQSSDATRAKVMEYLIKQVDKLSDLDQEFYS